MIQRDKRYNLIKSLLSDGKIKVLSDIFDWVPKTIVSHDLGKKVSDFNKLLAKPGRFTMEDIYLIGNFCGLKERQIYELYEAYYLKIKGQRTTKKSKTSISPTLSE